VSYIRKQVDSNPSVRKRKVAWPDRHQWASKFSERLRADEKAENAFKSLMRCGCLWGNLMSFLYAYTLSPVTVFQHHSRRRDAVLKDLKGVAGRLDRAAIRMQKILDTEWWSTPTFGSFLQERCRFDFRAVSSTGAVISGKVAPITALHLPGFLKSHSAGLNHLRKELQEALNARRVGKVIYLAEFATYIQMLTQQPIPWDVFAELVNVAQLENSKDRPVDASLLQKNFKNFINRNEELYGNICANVTAYLAACAQLPDKEKLTLGSWTAKRRASKDQSS
jgi:hypothetical protein